jgi:hypothetical protein
MTLSAGYRRIALGCAAAIALVLGCDGPQAGDVPVDSASDTLVAQAPRRLPPSASGEIGSGLRVAAAPEKPAAKKYEPLFVNWPEPAFVLFVTGQQQGYIEPCGCTGLANQKGGLARRHTLRQQLAEKRWPVIGLDAGNQVRRNGRQQEIKFQMTVEGLKKIGYHAIAFGPEDLRLSAAELLSIAGAEDVKKTPFVSANVSIVDEALTPKHRVLKVGDKTIGITSVLGEAERKRIVSDEIIHTSPDDGLKAVWPKLAAARCDLYVLIAHASLDESAALAKKFPGFDLIVSAGGAGEPTYQPEKIDGSKAVLIQVGTKGMHAGVVGFFPGDAQKLRYQRVPLDDRFKDSREMLELMASYQDQLKAAGLDGLQLKPAAHPSGNQFVGSKTCGECHSKAFAIWENTPHAHATDSLVHPNERTEIARHFDPECLSCHVTGWNPQKYYPYNSGYLDLKASLAMHGNGCENCHGPGSAHVAAENGDVTVDAAQIARLRAAMRLPLAEAERRCIECHDHDNSPEFHAAGAFEKYWEQVKHVGKD